MAKAASCTASTGAVSIPDYRSADALPTDGSGYIDLHCTCSGGLDCLAFTYTIDIQGTANGGPTARKMKRNHGAETLAYSLYQDALRLVTWGTGLNAYSGLWLLNQFGTTARIPVYARLAAGQVRPADSYSDTPAVVVSF